MIKVIEKEKNVAFEKYLRKKLIDKKENDFARNILWCNLFFSIYFSTTVSTEHDMRVNPKFQRNWVFATNSNFVIPISLQPDGVNGVIFQTEIIWSNRIHILKYLRYTTFTKILGLENQSLRRRLNSLLT